MDKLERRLSSVELMLLLQSQSWVPSTHVRRLADAPTHEYIELNHLKKV